MKRTALTLSLLSFVGCGNATGPEPVFTISAVVNGAPWSPGGERAPKPSAQYAPDDGVFVFEGTRSDGPHNTRTIVVSINATGPGTYELAAPDSGSWAMYVAMQGVLGEPDFNWDFYWTTATTSGRVVITEWDKRAHTVAGTFEFNGEVSPDNVVIVSAGTFAGKYTVTQ